MSHREGLGDMDTTCAIAGEVVGIGAATTAWLELRELLPDWAEML